MIDWIDREDEVPGHDGRVLVMVEQDDGDIFVDISCYLEYYGRFQNEYHDAFKVVAWAELPKPWGEEEEDESLASQQD